MKKILIVVIVIISVSCATEKRVDKSNNSTTYKDSLAIVRILQNEWPKAYKEQDTILIKQILANNFKVIDASGEWSDKEGEIKWIAENKSTMDSLSRNIKRFEFLGKETALVAGTGYIYNKESNFSYEFTDVFVKKNGTWLATASHVSGVKGSD